MAGLLAGAGCRTGHSDVIVFDTEEEIGDRVAEESVAVPVPAEPVSAPAVAATNSPPEAGAFPAETVPSETVREGRPWWKLWGRPKHAVLETAPVPEETDSASATGAVATVEAEPVAAPVETAAVESIRPEPPPAGRRWYRFWRRNPAEKAPENGAEEPADLEKLPSRKTLFSPSGEPLIRPGYTLRLSVNAAGKTELSEQIKIVSDKGDINLPLIGAVACDGMTVQELSDVLEKRYEQYIREPNASVEFVFQDRPGEISPWGAVTVYGHVKSTGRVNIPPTRDLTLSRAIQALGGYRDGAKQNAIEVTRQNKDGTRTKMVIDLERAARRGEVEKDIVLEHGDVIYVPESSW